MIVKVLTFIWLAGSFCHAKTQSFPLRTPNQENETPADDLLVVHNCRILVDLTFLDKSHRILILPYNVRSEADCRIIKKNHEVVQDPAVLKKEVQYLWRGN